jgi:hypothetical protein
MRPGRRGAIGERRVASASVTPSASRGEHDHGVLGVEATHQFRGHARRPEAALDVMVMP